MVSGVAVNAARSSIAAATSSGAGLARTDDRLRRSLQGQQGHGLGLAAGVHHLDEAQARSRDARFGEIVVELAADLGHPLRSITRTFATSPHRMLASAE
jgi:hypothetical protein